MKASDILRRAAELVEDHKEAGCWAIDIAFDEIKYRKPKRRAHKYYRSLFNNNKLFWFGNPYSLFGLIGPQHIENNKHRVLVFFLMVDIVESIGD